MIQELQKHKTEIKHIVFRLILLPLIVVPLYITIMFVLRMVEGGWQNVIFGLAGIVALIFLTTENILLFNKNRLKECFLNLIGIIIFVIIVVPFIGF